MDVWVSQWHPDMDEEECSLAKTPQDLWSIVQTMVKTYPNDHIVIVPAD